MEPHTDGRAARGDTARRIVGEALALAGARRVFGDVAGDGAREAFGEGRLGRQSAGPRGLRGMARAARAFDPALGQGEAVVSADDVPAAREAPDHLAAER